MTKSYIQANNGIILLGGRGKRLGSLTSAVNKHLLPVYDQPLALLGIDLLLKLGVKQIIAVTDAKDQNIYQALFETYKERVNYPFTIKYAIQNKPLGTAHAISLCKKYLRGQEKFWCLWGDNVFEFVPWESQKKPLKKGTLRIHIIKTKRPENFGVVEIKNGKVISLEEKPTRPKSNYICTGLFLFPSEIFSKINKLSPNRKGEKDIMDVIKVYMREDRLDYQLIRGRWFDIGVSPKSLLAANLFAYKSGVNKLYKPK